MTPRKAKLTIMVALFCATIFIASADVAPKSLKSLIDKDGKPIVPPVPSSADTPDKPTEKPATTEQPPTKKTTTTETPKTTTTEAPETTTSEPATTTTEVPTTTVAPTPTPEVKFPDNVGTWNVTKENTNSTCIKFRGALQLQIVYEKEGEETTTNATTNVDIPKTAKASGKCGNDTQTMTLKWDSSEKEQHVVTFTFVANRTSSELQGASNNEIARGKYGLKMVEGVIQKDENLFPNATDPDVPVTLHLNGHGSIQTIFKHSYLCNSVESIKGDNASVTLKMAKVHLDAFRDPSSPKDFSAANVCIADDAGDIVPIAVGAALAGLVVIVLIAYLIGRRRSRSRGYQSV